MDYGLLVIEGSDYKIEDTSEFGNSYFRKEYMQAYKTLGMIINNTRDRRQNRSTQIQNIIPFIGKRGTGKTSAMLSFAQSLRKYHVALSDMEREAYRAYLGTDRYNVGKTKSNNTGNQPYFVLRDENEEPLNLKFVCLDCIDGFLLEQEEDIFRIILGQMYAKIEQINQKEIKERGNYEYDFRDLQLRFDKVYRTVCKLGKSESAGVFYEESAITSLKNLTSSLTIKKEFGELVQQYLRVMAYSDDGKVVLNGRPEEQFLVITIDDLDMNIRSGYEMLSKITRYMMVDNVIVLFAADYDQLKILCEREFYQMVPNFDRKLREKDAEVERLARDYLEKVIPADDRIYIPDLRKVADVQVRVGESNNMLLKELIFAVLNRKLGLRMDTGGGKRHFFEQSSLRAFVNFFLMLNRMENLRIMEAEPESEFNASYLTIFEANYRILMSDTLTRMVDERLNAHYKEVFQRITEMPHPNSFRNLYFEMLKGSGEMGIDSGASDVELNGRNKAYLPDLTANLEYYGYSYGEVLRIIYCWGRENVFCKETIRCLIAFYTLELNRSLQYYCKSTNRAIRRAERTKFIETMNGSVAGSWANKMFPKVLYKGVEHRIGYRKNVDMKRVFTLEFTPEYLQMEDGKYVLERGKWEYGLFEPGELREQRLEESRQLFRTVLVMGMFFEQPYYKAERIFSWDIQKSETSGYEHDADSFIKPSERTLLNNSGGRAFFGIFSFVSNVFCYRENMKPLMNSLYKCLFASGGKADEIRKEREAFYKELGIDREYEEWEKLSYGFVLPVYDFDLMYNLMKRLRQREYFSESIEPKKVLNQIRIAFDFINRKLTENDEYYRQAFEELDGVEVMGNNEHTKDNYSKINALVSFGEIFESCPFVKWIVKKKDENGKWYLLPQFDKIFANMISRLLEGNTSSELQEKDAPDIHGYDD